MEAKDFKKSISDRASALRIRTYVMTISILITLVFYLFVNVTTKQAISWIDFVLLCVVQILIYSTYFPDGELFGARDTTFQQNKSAYNEKAVAVNEEHKIALLRDFCKVDFERRIKTYIENECGALGITLEELDQLRALDPDVVKKLKEFTFKYPTENPDKPDEKLVKFTRHKRKRIYNLLFKPIPVEENHAETIMSAIENNGQNAIKDTSVSFKTRSYIMKVIKAVIIGGLFAYIGYTLRDGIGIPEIVNICMYLTTIIANAVMAYTTGETCTKVYKNRFYVELANFIDEFREWERTIEKPVEKRAE